MACQELGGTTKKVAAFILIELENHRETNPAVRPDCKWQEGVKSCSIFRYAFALLFYRCFHFRFCSWLLSDIRHRLVESPRRRRPSSLRYRRRRRRQKTFSRGGRLPRKYFKGCRETQNVSQFDYCFLFSSQQQPWIRNTRVFGQSADKFFAFIWKLLYD